SSRERVLRGTLAAALVAGVVAMAFGAGYQASSVQLTDGGAYVQKAFTVVHANAARGATHPQAVQALATGPEGPEVVQVGPDALYVVNHATGQVYRLPTDSLQPQKVDTRSDAPGKLSLATGGGRTYLVDPGRGTVTLLPSGDAGGQRADVPTGGPIDQLVVDPPCAAGGRAARARRGAGGSTGERVRTDGAAVVDRRRAGRPGAPATLTLAAGHPVVYDAGTGDVIGYDPDGGPAVNLAVPGGVAAAPGTAVPTI